MIRTSIRGGALALALSLAACNQTSGSSVAANALAGLDQTGIAGLAVSMAESDEPETSKSDIDLSAIAMRLEDVAAGNTAPPNYLRDFDRGNSIVMAKEASADIAIAETQRAAEQLVPNADRPAEARAILSLVDRPGGGSAAWQNPATGASGTVTVQEMGRGMTGSLECRNVKREWRGGGTVRRGDMLACRNRGEWYEMS
ncbi:hypothetical protein [Microvirga roseola]|uniref:hypothetical protein n=1 Tax=Microvirga roseola TaxID=2883126 RepID=UPI001E39F540|nr:hypothetical protein [Microvirga roseola]